MTSHSVLLVVRDRETGEIARPMLTAIGGYGGALADNEKIDWEASRRCARTLLFETGERKSPPRTIILRHCHEPKMSGMTFVMEDDAKYLDVPMVCGCVAAFAPAGWTEDGDDGVAREVWKQVGFRFNEYRGSL